MWSDRSGSTIRRARQNRTRIRWLPAGTDTQSLMHISKSLSFRLEIWDLFVFEVQAFNEILEALGYGLINSEFIKVQHFPMDFRFNISYWFAIPFIYCGLSKNFKHSVIFKFESEFGNKFSRFLNKFESLSRYLFLCFLLCSSKNGLSRFRTFSVRFREFPFQTKSRPRSPCAASPRGCSFGPPSLTTSECPRWNCWSDSTNGQLWE